MIRAAFNKLGLTGSCGIIWWEEQLEIRFLVGRPFHCIFQERDNEAKDSSDGNKDISGFGWSQCQIR